MNVASTVLFLAEAAEDDATIAFSMSEAHDRVVTESVLKSELTVLKSEMKSELKSALADLEKRVETRISEDGKTTRRHFNIMVEKVNDSVRLVPRSPRTTPLFSTTTKPGCRRSKSRPEGLRYVSKQA